MKFSLLDLIFPKYCSGCKRLGSYVCLVCQKKIRYLPDICVACGKPSYFGVTHKQCNSMVDAFVGVVVYKEFTTRVIKDSKYRLAAGVLEEFLGVVEPVISQKLRILGRLYPDFGIQAIPLHPKRMRERGFNQCDIVAKSVAKIAKRPVVNVLVRAKHNAPQARLPHKSTARQDNVRGIFEVRKNIDLRNRDVLLVDDVVTSGSTVSEAARALKRAGARRVAVFALAKG